MDRSTLDSIADLMELEPGSLNGSEILKDLCEWDSLATLSFIALADQDYRLSISGTQVAACVTTSDLAALLK